MAEAEKEKKTTEDVDPKLLENLGFLQAMGKVEMIRNLRLQEELEKMKKSQVGKKKE